MDEGLRNLIESKFRVPVNEGEDKTCTLQEAVRKHVSKGMAINLSTYGALTYQLMREFWGKDPGFHDHKPSPISRNFWPWFMAVWPKKS